MAFSMIFHFFLSHSKTVLSPEITRSHPNRLDIKYDAFAYPKNLFKIIYGLLGSFSCLVRDKAKATAVGNKTIITRYSKNQERKLLRALLIER